MKKGVKIAIIVLVLVGIVTAIIIVFNNKIVNHTVSLKDSGSNNYFSDINAVKRYLVDENDETVLEKSYATELFVGDGFYTFVRINEEPRRYFIFYFPESMDYSTNRISYYVFEVDNLSETEKNNVFLASGTVKTIRPDETITENVDSDVILNLDKKGNITYISCDSDDDWMSDYSGLMEAYYQYDNYGRISKIRVYDQNGKVIQGHNLKYEMAEDNIVRSKMINIDKSLLYNTELDVHSEYSFDGLRTGTNQWVINVDNGQGTCRRYKYEYDEAGRVIQTTYDDLVFWIVDGKDANWEEAPLAGPYAEDGKEYYFMKGIYSFEYTDKDHYYVSSFERVYNTENGNESYSEIEYFDENNNIIDREIN